MRTDPDPQHSCCNEAPTVQEYTGTGTSANKCVNIEQAGPLIVGADSRLRAFLNLFGSDFRFNMF